MLRGIFRDCSARMPSCEPRPRGITFLGNHLVPAVSVSIIFHGVSYAKRAREKIREKHEFITSDVVYYILPRSSEKRFSHIALDRIPGNQEHTKLRRKVFIHIKADTKADKLAVQANELFAKSVRDPLARPHVCFSRETVKETRGK